MRPIGPDRPPALQRTARTSPRGTTACAQLAANTDGLAVVNTNEIDSALRRIVADLSSYYLLGYYSTNTKLDGRFRNITVRVRRPGVQVRARRGYRGLTADQLLTAAEGEKRAAAAASSPVSVVVNPRAPFRIRTCDVDAPRRRRTARRSGWSVSSITRRARSWCGARARRAEVVVVAGDGTEIVSSTAPVPAADGTFALRIPETGGLAPGEYAVRVRVCGQSRIQDCRSPTAHGCRSRQLPRPSASR